MVFAMQGVGIMVAAVLFLLLAETGMPLAYMWRILLAFGAVPGLATMYWRVKMQETADYLAVTDRRLHAADWAENRRALCGTAGTWFLLDVTLYGNGVFAAKILKEQISGEFGERLARTSIFNLAVAAIGFLGYIAARFTIDRFPKRRQQIVGFVAVARRLFRARRARHRAGRRPEPVPVCAALRAHVLPVELGPEHHHLRAADHCVSRARPPVLPRHQRRRRQARAPSSALPWSRRSATPGARTPSFTSAAPSRCSARSGRSGCGRRSAAARLPRARRPRHGHDWK
jgi:hypothetical protein